MHYVISALAIFLVIATAFLFGRMMGKAEGTLDRMISLLDKKKKAIELISEKGENR